MAFGATTLALAQTTPPTNSSTSPTTSPSSPNPNGDKSNGAPAASADKSARDPKMKACMTAEKAKDSGLDDNQIKQKCMLQIASHQGH
jgi:hypothetical protein